MRRWTSSRRRSRFPAVVATFPRAAYPAASYERVALCLGFSLQELGGPFTGGWPKT